MIHSSVSAYVNSLSESQRHRAQCIPSYGRAQLCTGCVVVEPRSCDGTLLECVCVCVCVCVCE